MLHLPAEIAKYLCDGEPKTAHQMYKFVVELIAKEDSGISDEEASLILNRCIAAGQVEPGKTTASSISIKLEPVVQLSLAFQQWAKQKLVGYLRRETATSPKQSSKLQLRLFSRHGLKL
jgi:hypothetical protein